MIRKLKKVLSDAATDNSQRVSREEFMALVQKKAYELYEQRGRQPGNELEDWLTAERLVKEELSR
jgi:hypothetical protein